MELKVDHAAVVPLMPLFMQQIEFNFRIQCIFRCKNQNIQGISNGVKNDLSTLNQIEITNYKMKDRAKGTQTYKKVIAQQVESGLSK